MTKFEIPLPPSEINWGSHYEWAGLIGFIALEAVARVTGADAAIISMVSSNAVDTLLGIKEVVFGQNTNP